MDPLFVSSRSGERVTGSFAVTTWQLPSAYQVLCCPPHQHDRDPLHGLNFLTSPRVREARVGEPHAEDLSHGQQQRQERPGSQDLGGERPLLLSKDYVTTDIEREDRRRAMS